MKKKRLINKPILKKISKKDIEKSKAKIKGGIGEFRTFIMKGNVLDLAVGVIIGGAFGKIVSSLVNDILMPVIGIFMGGLNFTSLSIKFGSSTIMYGSFIQQIIDFVIIALCIFMIIKIFNKISVKKEEEVVKPKPDEIILLTEIRDLLTINKNNKVDK